MSTPINSRPEGSSGEENRVRCLYCGANNFPESPTCWQCARPLQPLRSQGKAVPGASSAAAMSTPGYATGRPAPGSVPDLTLAPKAAAALALMFPYIGLPVGMVFLMLDDARKTQLGWITIWWSVAGTAVNAILFFATLGPTLAALKSMMPHSAPGGIPGLPVPGGDGGDLNLLLPIICKSLTHVF